MGNGRKNVLNAFELVTAGDMSSDITSSPVPVEFIDNAGISMIWTGSPTGVLSVQASIDYSPTAPPRAGNWFDMTFDPALDQPAGSASSVLANVQQMPYPWIRVKYTRTSGTGSLNVWVSGKEI